MKANLVKIRKNRVFSEELKRNVVTEFEKGFYSVMQLSKLHHVHFSTIYNWIYKYSSYHERSIRVVEMKDSSTYKLKELESKVKELERALGQKQLYIDYMERMIEIAKDELGIDIKKNSYTPQSTGLGKTKRK